jgi:hypothetical protein
MERESHIRENYHMQINPLYTSTSKSNSKLRAPNIPNFGEPIFSILKFGGISLQMLEN